MKKRVLEIMVVDNDVERCERYIQELKTHLPGYKITVCHLAMEALAVLKTRAASFAVVLVDHRLPDMEGVLLCKEIVGLDYILPLIIVVDEGMEYLIAGALNAGADDYLIKDRKGNYLQLVSAVLKKAIINLGHRVARCRAESAREESEEKFRKVFMLSPDTVFISSLKDGRIIEVNENVLKDFGYHRTEVIGRTTVEIGIIRAQDRVILKKMIKEKGFYNNIEFTLFTRNREMRHCLLSGHLINIGGEECIIQTVNDITARQRMEEELLKSKNLETIGILAGGIAFDFNHLLTSIMGNLSIAKMSLDDVEKIYRALSRAEEIAIEAADLAGKLLTFSKGGEPVNTENSLTSLLYNIMNTEIKAPHVQIEYIKENDVWSVKGDESQLKNLFLNVLTNAVEAIPAGRHGRVTVRAENVFISWDNRLALEEGNYVKLIVEDNGVGIAEENLDRIFAPYYTTKNFVTRQGVGLGLSICQSIVKKHNGHISAQSRLGKGSSFTIYLPAYAVGDPVHPDNDHSFLTGTGRILVMDDEQYIGDITDKMLKQMGYQVDIAREGDAALALYKNALGTNLRYDAVILNLTNKVGMGGEDALARLLEIDPKVKAIVSSGYLEDAKTLKWIKAGFCEALKKPYSITRLCEVLNKVISGSYAAPQGAKK